MSFKIQVRRGTTSEWTTTNPVLSSGELGYDTDLKIFKIGDGAAAWNSLAIADKDQQTAAQVPYTNTTSELQATDVQAALDELAVILTSGDLEVDLSTAAGTALVWNAQSEQFDVDFADNTAAIAGESTTTVINPATLGTVLSNKIASQADAEAGTDNTVLMTPLRTAQAIAELAGESGGTGSANVTNYQVVINASDTWAPDQITVVETEDFNAEGVSGDGIHAVNDATHIYRYGISEATLNTVLQKINKETLVQEQEVILPEENLYEVFNIAIDSTHVYILTGDIDDIYEVQKYLKSDLSFVAKEPLADLKLAIAQDDDYLYIGGVESGVYVPDGVGLYEKDTLEQVINTTAYGSVIESVFVDDQYVYGAGGDYEKFAHPVTVWDKSKQDFVSFTQLFIPGTIDTYGLAFSPDGTYLVIPEVETSINIYKKINNTYSLLSNIQINESNEEINAIAFSKNNNYLAIAVNPNEVVIYKQDGDVFTKLVSPLDISPTGNIVAMNFSPNGNYLIVGTSGSGPLLIYKRTGDSFNKLINPNEVPSATIYDIAFSPDGTYLALAVATSVSSSPLFIYKQNGDIFTKLADPAILPNPSGLSVAFSPDGTYLALGTQGDFSFDEGVDPLNYLYAFVYKRSGDTFTKLADLDLPDTRRWGESISFDNSGDYLFIGSAAESPYTTPPVPMVSVFKRSGDTFTPSLEIMSTFLSERVYAMALSPDNQYTALGTSKGSYVYKNNLVVDTFGNTPDYIGILKTVVADSNFIYAAGEQDPIADSVIVKYSKETLEILGTSTAVGGAVDKLEQDGDCIYALSVDAQVIRQYTKSDLSLVSSLTISNIQSFTQDSQFIYAFETLIGELSKATKGSVSYNLTKSVSGITATDEPIVDIDLSNNNFSDVSAIQEAWGLVYRLETAADSVKLYATEEPVFPADTNVKLKVVE